MTTPTAVTYFQHKRDEQAIVAVFLAAEPYGQEFGKDTYPAIFFQHTTLTYVGPQTFSPAGEQSWYAPVAREVAVSLYPHHVHWTEGIIASCRAEVSPPPLWPDLQVTTHLQGSDREAHVLMSLTSSLGQQVRAFLNEPQLGVFRTCGA